MTSLTPADIVHRLDRIQLDKSYRVRVYGGTKPTIAIRQYTDADLSTIRDNLNRAKSRLDQYDGIFASYAMVLDVYRPLRRRVSELYAAKYVTNAWLKYAEIYLEYRIFDHLPHGRIYALFNAELPGAGLAATNHIVKTQYPTIDLQWYASSLAPSTANKNTSEALGDTYGLYAGYQDRWLMDLTGQYNGDMMRADCIRELTRRIHTHTAGAMVHLYSHDAGLDVGIEHNNQEALNLRLHMGCMLAGLCTLAHGGVFIAKQYTLFETLTWNLVEFCASRFDKFYIHKPCTSRAMNSEIYLIGIGYRGVDREIIDELLRVLERPDLDKWTLYRGHRAPSEILQCETYLAQRQQRMLSLAADVMAKYGENTDILRGILRQTTVWMGGQWLKTYRLRPILAGDQLNPLNV